MRDASRITWTAQDDDALQLLKDGWSKAELGELIGRTPHAIVNRRAWLNMTPEQRVQHNISKNQSRHRIAVAGPKLKSDDIPDAVWEDRNRRLSASRTLTAILMGDPA